MSKTTPNMTFIKVESCECGDVELYEMEILLGPKKGEKVVMKKGCECENIQLAKEATEMIARAKNRRLREVFDKHSLISKELQKANLENYKPKTELTDRAKRIAERYIDVFDTDKPRNLLFTGSYGLGKSHLAKSIADGIMSKRYEAIFISVPKLLSRLKASYDRGTEYTELDLIEALNKTDLLVLDDLGAEKSSDWSFEKLFEIVDSRQGMNTIYTTNFTPEDLITKLGERNFSRVMNQDTELIKMDGDNYRLSKFKEG